MSREASQDFLSVGSTGRKSYFIVIKIDYPETDLQKRFAVMDWPLWIKWILAKDEKQCYNTRK